MKELSIEEKAKAYDEVVEKAKIEKEKSRNLGLLEFIDENFPELKESEDERVRKEIISAIEEDWPGHTDWIAWLEKQGQKPVYKVEPKFKVKYAGSEYNVLNVKDIAGVTYYGIEDEPNHIDYVLPNNCEIVSEQKPVDKVEPKFHDREWITHNTANFVFKIINVGSNGYEVVNRENYKKTISFDNEDNYHLWTIQDAKDGDVLFCKGELKYSNGIKYERICLFNNLDNAFFTLTKTSNFVEEYDIDVNIDYPDNTVPATKEQKEILFMAMKDAGYEWDSEKKELKKIEQKPVAWSEEDERKIYRIYSILGQAADTHAFSTSCRLIGDKECIELQDFLKSLRPQSKQVLRDTFGYEDGRQFGKNEVLGNPEKYGLQRFAEWSKSDKEIVKEIDIIIHGTNSISDEVRKKLQDWLKSLRPQNRWKPSDEQMNALNDVISSRDIKYDVLSELWTDLKKLREEQL